MGLLGKDSEIEQTWDERRGFQKTAKLARGCKALVEQPD
jgi:hypothetical protein